MKGLSVSVIGSVVLALIGVTVMIGLFTDISPIDTESGFCTVYNGLSPSLPSSITPTVAGCSEGSSINYQEIRTNDKDELALKLAVGIQECWKEFKGYDVDFKRCEAWSISEAGDGVTEGYINEKMMENNICPDLIENSQIESSGSEICGDENQIRFQLEEVNQNDFVLIGYNSSSSGFIEVR